MNAKTVAVLVVIVILLGIIGYGYIKIGGYDALYDSQQQIIAEKELENAGLIDKWIHDKQITLTDWSTDSFFKTVFTSSTGKEHVTKELERIKKLYDYYKAIAIIDSNGEILVSSNPSYVGDVIVDKELYFNTAMDGNIPDPHFSDCSDCTIVTIASPIAIDGTYPIGVMIAVLEF